LLEREAELAEPSATLDAARSGEGLVVVQGTAALRREPICIVGS
jgi:hypothetical protein